MNALDRLIRFSLLHRLAILLAAGSLLTLGGAWVARMPVDVFPDLSAPTITVITEAPGLAPEEVELLVTFPIESALNGTADMRRLRSVSGDGISVAWVELAWGTEIHRARQQVAERLSRVELPAQAHRPELGPMSSIMGEITFIALTSDTLPPTELRRQAEVLVRRSLLALPGISQVVPIGGEVRQLELELEPLALLQHQVSLAEVLAAATAASGVPAPGFHVAEEQEYLVRGLGRVRSPAELAAAVVATRSGVPLRLGDLGIVRWGVEPLRGTASYRAKPAVVLSVQKQPGANTLALTRAIDQRLLELAPSLPPGVTIEKENFRQADFIAVAVRNVSLALRDGAIFVVAILLLFLGNLRATFVSAVAIPLSLVAGALVVSAFGGALDTMTLGGLTIAIGALVDDAIIDVENVFRRLRQEHAKPEAERRDGLEVVFRASSEVRQAILFATLIIVLVFLPLFVLPGIEGRLLRPLGLAYVAALAASLLVSLTVTPVLCFLLLRRTKDLEARKPWLLRAFEAAYAPTLRAALARPGLVLAVAAGLTLVAAASLPWLGRSFLPPFNEGALTVSVVSPPGTALAESDRLGRAVETALLAFPEVVSTSRRTGRAERDEHVQGVNASELEVVLGPLQGSRDKAALLAEMRRVVATIPGVVVSFGQPISHRIDHMISGSKTNLAVKVFGPDLAVARGLAARVQQVLGTVPGIVDLSNQEQAAVPQLVLDFDRAAMARYGVEAAGLAKSVEALFQGTEVGEVVADGLVARVVVRFPASLRQDPTRLGALPVTTAAGEQVRLDELARVRFDLGPSLVRRENVERVAMVTANVEGVDLGGTVARAERAIRSEVELPAGYLVTLGGQFEEAERSVRLLGLLAVVVFAGMYGLLYLAFASHRDSWIVLVNLPLALPGGVAAVWLADGVLSIAALVGFATLFGIATRNGVLMVSHFRQLMAAGMPRPDAVRLGAAERLAPILMTALTAGLALIPLVVAGAEPGNEIQSPMARVILGGLLTSTFLNLVVVPALYARWGRAAGDAAQA